MWLCMSMQRGTRSGVGQEQGIEILVDVMRIHISAVALQAYAWLTGGCEALPVGLCENLIAIASHPTKFYLVNFVSKSSVLRILRILPRSPVWFYPH